MRERDACPDLGLTRTVGQYLPVEGSGFEFPECPAAYLRMPSDLMALKARFRKPPFAPHLIDGVTHPAQMVSEVAFEVESGARSSDGMTPKMSEAVHLYIREKSHREAHASELRRKARA